MRVLVIGGGGREHALVWKFKQSPLLEEIFVWPGNVATLRIARSLIDSAKATHLELAKACKIHKIDLVVVGPEGPLSDGLADEFIRHDIRVFGPNKLAAQLESSKVFAKKIMMDAGIPTATYEVAHTKEQCMAAAARLLNRDGGVVLKANGLASGKGVFVCKTVAEVANGIDRLYDVSLKEAAHSVVVEEILYGRECSYFCLLGDGKITRLGFAVDHKRLLVGDKGPNTGGMGCYTPVPWLPYDAAEQVEARVVEPLLDALSRVGIHYTGCLYVGVMWSDAGPAVVEFNVRFGDPEAQVLAMSDASDWLPAIAAKVGIKLEQAIKYQSPKSVIGYVLASSGYPYGEAQDHHAVISDGLLGEGTDGSVVFQASVKQAKNGIETCSGRVLLVAAAGKSFAIAKIKAMDRVQKILKVWPDAKWRPDIAHAALQSEEASVSAVGRLPIVLGSSSPRRRELLGHLGLDFSIIKPETEEIPREGEKPLDYVQRNAHDKNRWICDFLRKSEANPSLVICADTIVLVDGILLEKPGSPLEAKEMLTRLSGKKHTVFTAVSIARTARLASEDELREFVVATDVLIKPMTSQEMDGYIATGEPFDKAGGYAAQGLGSFMVQEIHGSFSNVVGLPLAELGDVLTKDFCIPLWRDR